MKQLTLNNLEDLAIGAAILGSGGGGDPAYPHMMAKNVAQKWGNSKMISISELQADDLVIPIGVIGAPLAESEKIASGREFSILLEVLEKTIGKKVTAVMPFEIGGGNAFTPMMIAPILDIPILDADTMGRAFPEAQMCSCGLLGASCSPGFITDSKGNSVVIYANNNFSLEKIGRQVTVAMGSSAMFGLYPLSGSEAKKMTFPKSISKAMAIGKAYRDAKNHGQDPLASILNTCKGAHLASGKITDIDRSITKGFLKGSVTIQNKTDHIELLFQNEFLLAKVNGKVVGMTPDILSLVEMETGFPITSESLQYGLKVHLIAIPSPSLWTTPEGLTLVGPRHFGYEIDYTPFQKGKSVSNHIEAIV